MSAIPSFNFCLGETIDILRESVRRFAEKVAQLAIGGRLVIPVGTSMQILTLIERTNNPAPKEYVQTKLEPVKFVPLLGGVS